MLKETNTPVALVPLGQVAVVVEFRHKCGTYAPLDTERAIKPYTTTSVKLRPLRKILYPPERPFFTINSSLSLTDLLEIRLL